MTQESRDRIPPRGRSIQVSITSVVNTSPFHRLARVDLVQDAFQGRREHGGEGEVGTVAGVGTAELEPLRRSSSAGYRAPCSQLTEVCPLQRPKGGGPGSVHGLLRSHRGGGPGLRGGVLSAVGQALSQDEKWLPSSCDLGYASARRVPWLQLRYEHVQAIRTGLGAFPGEERERERDVRSGPGSAFPAGRALSNGGLKALMDACADGSPSGARDAAVIALGHGVGLRRTEIAGLSLGDVRIEGDGMVVRVLGKGPKERLVYLDDGAAEAIADYIEVRGAQAGALLWSARKGGKLNASVRINDEAVRAGVDIATVAAMAGHSRVTTTQRPGSPWPAAPSLPLPSRSPPRTAGTSVPSSARCRSLRRSPGHCSCASRSGG